MQPSELKEATAQQGFTQFIMSNDTARMFLDIHIDTYTTIDSLSSGWYGKDRIIDNATVSVTGWDQQWNNISIGNSTDDSMTIDGLVLMADFDATGSNLQRIVFGSNRLQGDLSADFSTYSGTYNNALLTGGTWGAASTLDRETLGSTTFHFNSNGYQANDMGMFFIINMDGPQQGLQVVSGFDEQSLSPNQWWDSP
ncbi:hypothetical protein DSLASN_11910 [Desulfoluna limicola]|uniref:Uncharacterized protein n=1 Tax=Desulfoluna limicola TaxID=2810562 RepID=A0ABM7PD37_9BACT|nr:hypothetical protein [Desulfoluna limicola]BCS95559.1 hypothetical protein DSLASN_11910 [Desulfoluna limicola]